MKFYRRPNFTPSPHFTHCRPTPPHRISPLHLYIFTYFQSRRRRSCRWRRFIAHCCCVPAVIYISVIARRPNPPLAPQQSPTKHNSHKTRAPVSILYRMPCPCYMRICGLYVYVYCVWNIVRNWTLSIVATVVGGTGGNGATAMVMTVVVVWRWCIIQNPNDCSV